MARTLAVESKITREPAGGAQLPALTFAVAGPLIGPHGIPKANFIGTFSVKAFDLGEASFPIVLTGILSGRVTFPDDPDACIYVDEQEVVTSATLKSGFGFSSASSIYHLAAASSCVPLLTLGRVDVPAVGLFAELKEIVLDTSRDSGSQSLFGTLLSALTAASAA